MVAVTRTSAAGHPLHQAVSFHFTFSKVFSSFTFFMILCFSLILFEVLLYSLSYLVFLLFLSFLRVSDFFVFHLFKQKISSCFISSFSICSCSDSFSMTSSFFQLFLFHLFLKLFFHTKKLVTPFVYLFFSILFFLNIFLCFSFCSLVCSFVQLFTMRFVHFFLLESVPSLFFFRKILFLISFRFF